MRPLLLALFVVLAPSLARAQNAVPLNIQKIAYQHSLPAAVARRMPRGAKSFYWGTFRPNSASPQYGLHLFKADPAQGKSWGESSKQQKFTLDIFEVRRSGLKRINRLPFNYPSYTWGVSRVGVAFTWLDPTARTIPLLQFDIWSPEGIYGNIGENVYAAFPHGLKGNVGIRSLQFGSWNASDTSGQSNELRLGSDGKVEILANVHPATGEVTAQQIHDQYTFALHWDAKTQNFVPDAHALNVAEGTPSLKPFMGLSRTYDSAR